MPADFWYILILAMVLFSAFTFVAILFWNFGYSKGCKDTKMNFLYRKNFQTKKRPEPRRYYEAETVQVVGTHAPRTEDPYIIDGDSINGDSSWA